MTKTSSALSVWGRLASSVVAGVLALGGATLPPAWAGTASKAAVGQIDPADTPPAPGQKFGLSAASLKTHCDGDGSSGKRVQVVYLRFSDRPNRYAANLGSFRHWAAQANAKFEDSAARTGGHRHIRFVHDADCNVVVAQASVSPSIMEDGDPYAAMKSELKPYFGNEDRKYMFFADFPADDVELFDNCGKGEQPLDDSAGAANESTGTGLGFTFLTCWDNGTTPGHELAHNLGAVQLSAPHSDANGHCSDGNDALCDVVAFPPLCIDHGDAGRFDCNHDDYFSTNPLTGNYLSTHWNVADSPYLATGGQSQWGYVWADQPVAANYVPATARQQNSSGATNTVSRQSPGTYVVDFPNVVLARGSFPHVSAAGPGAGWCQARSWSQGWVGVSCFDPDGSPADRPFLVSVNTPAGTIGPLAQVVALGALSRDSGFNSAGGTNTVQAAARRGVWHVRMPGVGAGQKAKHPDRGSVQVTTVGATPAACQVVPQWVFAGPDVLVTVRCHDVAGALVDAPFVVSYGKGLDVTGIPGRTGYAGRDEKGSVENTSLFGSGAHKLVVVDSNVDPKVTLVGTGVWTVRIDQVAPPQPSNGGGGSGDILGTPPPARGHVQVSAAGASHHCGVDSWKSAPDGPADVIVTVKCFDHDGQPVSGGFNASYTTD